MADLRSGSTVGGNTIATLNDIGNVVSKDQITLWNGKRNRVETALASNTIDALALSSNNNGTYQFDNLTSGGTTFYGKSTLLNESNLNSRLQLIANHVTSASDNTPGLYFRTGIDSTLGAWKRLATYDLLTTELNKKLNLTGGTITGATNINATLTATNLTVNNPINITANENTLKIGSYNAAYTHFVNSANIPFHFNKDVKVQGEIYAGTAYDKKVWHTGNFNPGIYITKSTLLGENYNLDTLTTEGNYRVLSAVNRPSKMINWAYVEVLYHSDDYVLQKIYNYEGTLAYFRTKSSGVWRPWKSLGGGSMSYIKTISLINEWTAANNIYELVLTHSLGSTDIINVTFTDITNLSVLIGFEVIDSNKIKVFCGSNPTGKINVTAIG